MYKMRKGVVDWLALLGLVLSTLLGAIIEKETDGEVTRTLYLEDNTTKVTCEKQFKDIIITDR